MKLELKAVKHSEWASQETNCYQATIYLEGKPFASVQNEGFGGPTSIYRDHRFKGDMKDWNYKKERVNKYLQMNFEDVWDFDWETLHRIVTGKPFVLYRCKRFAL